MIRFSNRLIITLITVIKILTASGQESLWNHLECPWTSESKLFDVEFVDSLNGYVAVDTILYKTTNGGCSWTKVLSHHGLLLDICFINDSVGYVLTVNNFYFKTRNYGYSWEIKCCIDSENSSTVPLSFHFADERVGYVFRNPGEIQYTADSGNTWETVFHGLHIYKKMSFPSKNKGYMVGNGGQILLIDSNTVLSGLIGNQYFDNKSVSFINDSVGYMVTEYLDTNYILKTVNGGYEWQVIYTNDSIIDIMDIEFLDNEAYFLGFLEGSGVSMFRSTDSGTSWQEDYISWPYSLEFIKISKDKIVLTGGDLGLLYVRDKKPAIDPVAFPKNILICPDSFINLDAGSHSGSSILWSTGDTSQSISVNMNGSYSVDITNDYCTKKFTTDISYYNALAKIIGDKFICDEGVTLSFDNNHHNNWYVNDIYKGSADTILISGSAIVILESIEGECVFDYDTVSVIHLPNDSIPIITLVDSNMLKSSYKKGNQWYYEDSILVGENDETLFLEEYGEYHVKVSRSSSCDIYSNKYGYYAFSISQGVLLHDFSSFPNPYEEHTNIEYIINHKAEISLELFSVLGEKLLTLDQGVKFPNNYSYSFSAKREGFSSGVYFLKLTVDGNVYTQKLLEL